MALYPPFWRAIHKSKHMVKCRMLSGIARIIVPSRTDRSKTGVIYIPADLVKDSSFPFQADEEVTIRIEGQRLIVERR